VSTPKVDKLVQQWKSGESTYPAIDLARELERHARAMAAALMPFSCVTYHPDGQVESNDAYKALAAFRAWEEK